MHDYLLLNMKGTPFLLAAGACSASLQCLCYGSSSASGSHPSFWASKTWKSPFHLQGRFLSQYDQSVNAGKSNSLGPVGKERWVEIGTKNNRVLIFRKQTGSSQSRKGDCRHTLAMIQEDHYPGEPSHSQAIEGQGNQTR